MLYPLLSSYLGSSSRNYREKATSLTTGTSLETVESQQQQGELYSGLPNLAEEGKRERKVRNIFEVMVDLAITNEGTPSMIDEVDDDMAPLGRVSKQKMVGHDEDGIPIASPNRIDAVAKSTMEDPTGRPEIKCYTVSKKP